MISTINHCIALDRAALGGETVTENMQQLVQAHLELAQVLQGTGEDEIVALEIDDELRQQILSERQLLKVFGSKGDYETVTFLTTFTCYLLSREDGEPMHSRKYMEDVKRLHALVNTYYGKDPAAAHGCSNI